MAEPNKPPRWFCRNSSTGDVQGPFDLLELAGLLRSGDITGETLTQAEGDESWVAFQDRLEFKSAKAMPAAAIYQHLKDEADQQQSPWSLRGLYYLGSFLLGTLGYALFGGFRPTWQTYQFQHWLQNFVLYALGRMFGH